MKSINPYLNFNGNCEEAFRFYKSVFGGELVGIVRFKDMKNKMGLTDEEKLNKIANIALPIGKDTLLMGDDGPAVFDQTFPKNSNFSICLEADGPAEAEELFKALSDDGEIKMPLQQTEWAEKFGMCTDRFSVRWMINYTGEKA
jgi:PhnB protein